MIYLLSLFCEITRNNGGMLQGSLLRPLPFNKISFSKLTVSSILHSARLYFCNNILYISISELGCALVLHPEKPFQKVEGFGGAVTDAAGINWKNLSDPLQKSLIE